MMRPLPPRGDAAALSPPDAGRSGPRPGAAAMATDSESGTENLDSNEDRRRSLFALKTMFERGLIPAAEYERRRAELEG
ncbi:MAG: hypothetical protein RLY86_2292 [Pseudomonadota bacterium]